MGDDRVRTMIVPVAGLAFGRATSVSLPTCISGVVRRLALNISVRIRQPGGTNDFILIDDPGYTMLKRVLITTEGGSYECSGEWTRLATRMYPDGVGSASASALVAPSGDAGKVSVVVPMALGRTLHISTPGGKVKLRIELSSVMELVMVPLGSPMCMGEVLDASVIVEHGGPRPAHVARVSRVDLGAGARVSTRGFAKEIVWVPIDDHPRAFLCPGGRALDHAAMNIVESSVLVGDEHIGPAIGNGLIRPNVTVYVRGERDKRLRYNVSIEGNSLFKKIHSATLVVRTNSGVSITCEKIRHSITAEDVSTADTSAIHEDMERYKSHRGFLVPPANGHSGLGRLNDDNGLVIWYNGGVVMGGARACRRLRDNGGLGEIVGSHRVFGRANTVDVSPVTSGARVRVFVLSFDKT